ncbi:MAG: hypothetical protein AAB434_02670 [Planctomycetota bacterium]
MRTTLVLCPVIALAAFAIAALARCEEPSRGSRPTAQASATQVALVPPAPAPIVAPVPSREEPPSADATETPTAPAARPFYDGLPAFADTPEGAFGRMKLGILAKDVAILRDATTVTDEKALQEILAAEPLLSAEVTSVEASGDQAKLEVTCQGQMALTMGASRVDGRWKIDPSLFREGTQCRDCMNNLRQLGTYIVMWVCKFGEETRYPGPGPGLFLDLFRQPTPEEAIARGGEAMVHCAADGGGFSPERVLAGDPTCMSYECTSQVLTDAMDPCAPIAWDRTAAHGGHRNVLFFSGSVALITEAEFLDLISRYGR